MRRSQSHEQKQIGCKSIHAILPNWNSTLKVHEFSVPIKRTKGPGHSAFLGSRLLKSWLVLMDSRLHEMIAGSVDAPSLSATFFLMEARPAIDETSIEK